MSAKSELVGRLDIDRMLAAFEATFKEDGDKVQETTLRAIRSQVRALQGDAGAVPSDKMLLHCNSCQKKSWVQTDEWTKMPSGGTWIRCPHCNVPINKLEDIPSFAHGTPERIALERLYNEEITVAKAVELLKETMLTAAPTAPQEPVGADPVGRDVFAPQAAEPRGCPTPGACSCAPQAAAQEPAGEKALSTPSPQNYEPEKK